MIWEIHTLIDECRDRDALRREVEQLRDELGKTRLCLTCGKTRPAEIPQHDPGEGCEATPEYGHLCMFDATPQEAVEHFREMARKNSVDAERYRWLRDGCVWTMVSANGMVRLAYHLPMNYFGSNDEAHEMDEAIDRAMREQALDRMAEDAPVRKHRNDRP